MADNDPTSHTDPTDADTHTSSKERSREVAVMRRRRRRKERRKRGRRRIRKTSWEKDVQNILEIRHFFLPFLLSFL